MPSPSTAHSGGTNGGFRLDVQLHDLLMNAQKRSSLLSSGEQQSLPEPVFPQRPEALADPGLDTRTVSNDGNPYRRRWTAPLIYRAMRGWLFPYMRAKVLPGDFHPMIAYLFTEWKCNLDCHYCWAFDNRVKGMTEDTARRAIDWLHDSGCRVLALMGGEVLLRPQFVHKVVYYAAKKGFWIYVPTNGRLMRPEVIDRLGDAGVATFNLAVDSVEERPELPKALNPIRPYFEYLIRKQYAYGYIVFFNMNITRINMDDIRQLTEIAHDVGIITDYHINESPMLEQEHFQHKEGNSTFLTPEDRPALDDLLEWLIARNRQGYKMVNSAQRLNDMKDFVRGQVQPWSCRAGHNSLIVRVDGTLAPCFPMYSATYDWGVVGDHKFEAAQLDSMKTSCERHCFSTLNHNLAYCFDTSRAIRWVLKQARRGFQGVSGSFD